MHYTSKNWFQLLRFSAKKKKKKNQQKNNKKTKTNKNTASKMTTAAFHVQGLGLWCLKPQVTDKRYHILFRVHLAYVGFELTTLVVLCTDIAQVIVNPTTIRSRPQRPLN